MAGTCPRLVVFSGGKGGVGVSTLAIHIAIALVDQGLRVVLVDADLYRADIAPLCKLPERGHVGDILSRGATFTRCSSAARVASWWYRVSGRPTTRSPSASTRNTDW